MTRKSLSSLTLSLLYATLALTPSCSGERTQDRINKDPLSDDPTTQPGGIGITVNKTDANSNQTELSKHTVMVIDDGFDPTHPVFSSKIEAKYTLDCAETEPAPYPNTYQERLNAAIEALGTPSTRCQIKKTLTLDKSPEIDTIAQFRDLWNGAIKSKKPVVQGNLGVTEAKNIARILSGQKPDGSTAYTYHGTATAGLVGYQNPDVRLVLLQVRLARSDKDAAGDGCPDLNVLADQIRIFQDAQFRQAYLNQPEDPVDKEIEAIVNRHHVRLVNFSAGSLTYTKQYEILTQEGCQLNRQQFISRSAELDALRYNLEQERLQATSQTVNYLVIQAAGNEGQVINSPADSADCLKDPGTLLVGSLNKAGGISSFSNRGDCVDLYILGENVVVAKPNGFLDVNSGTSFSAPLLVRYITEKFPATVTPQDLQEKLLQKTAPNGFLTQAAFPTEVAFENSSPIAAYALHANQAEPIKDDLAQILKRQKIREFFRNKRIFP